MFRWHLTLLGKYASTQRVDVRAPQPLVIMPSCNAVDYARICGGCGGRRVAGYGQWLCFIPGPQPSWYVVYSSHPP
jgi:hypothetical protein